MHNDEKSILLISMPFAGIAIPSVQLSTLGEYLKERDIDISTKNLYLKAADFYGLKNYNFLITTPNESYTAQMAFSKHVFPDNWEKNEAKIKEYYEKIISNEDGDHHNFNFEKYIEKTDSFYDWVIDNLNWEKFDIIGFTCNYGQFLPSLAIAKKIKEINPEKNIIFGGSRTANKLGCKILESFDFIDFIITGDGEESLYKLVSCFCDYQSISNLIYRKNKEIIWNKSDTLIDLDSLPMPSYDTFYHDLSLVSPEIQQFFTYYGRLPIEISRGCWWNKCSFCNYSIYLPRYREKNIYKIVDEIKYLSDKYLMLNFQVIGYTIPKKEHMLLFKEIKKLGRDFNFFAEARAGQLKREDYKILKDAGFTNIQIGIESLSESYLKKINKGTRVIDNIAAMKFCKEYGIENDYNLIINYPNEEENDFEETKRNIMHIKQYLDPPKLNNLLVGFESPIYNKPELYNIEELNYTDIDRLMFPENILKNDFSFFYDFRKKSEYAERNWKGIIEDWVKDKNKRDHVAFNSKNFIDKHIFYFLDGGGFIKIFDKRNPEQVRINILDENERRIFLSCLDVISYFELQKKFPNTADYELSAILNSFEKTGIVFREDNYFLSLPLDYKKIMGTNKEIRNNGIDRLNEKNIIQS